MSSEHRHYDIVGSGSMVVDRIVRARRILGPEEKAELQVEPGGAAIAERVGGVTLNHLGWARILGMRTAIFGKQADDPEGRLLRQGMERLGIEHRIDLSGSASSLAQVIVDEAGERAIYMARGATAELSAADLDARFADLIASSTLFSSEVSQLPLATVARAFELAREHGVQTVLDLDLPRAEALPRLGSEAELRQVLERTDVLKASAASLAGWIANADPEASLRALCDETSAWLVVLTQGKDGALIGWRDDAAGLTLARIEAVPVEVRDSTGAGDAFLGGLMAGLIEGLAPVDAARLANVCGAACCEQLGAYPEGIDATRRRVEQHLERLPGTPIELRTLEFPEARSFDPAALHFLNVATREIERVARGVDPASLERAAGLILEAEQSGGRVHVTGIGKPGHVAAYVAALLASTGTAAQLLDATETTHGSAGQLREGDVVIAISNSGGTPELLAAIQTVRDMGARVLGVTADPKSPLAAASEVVLEARVEDEGGPLGLAPRASILAEMLVLQALSVQLQVLRGFSRSDYHRRHPGGALGKRSADAE